MSVRDVNEAIRHVATVIREWDEAELPKWLETHTRYGIIDPVIRALGWNTDDPKQCHPEFPRWRGGRGRVDYALFQDPNASLIAYGKTPPIIIIESKALRTTLNDNHMAQLRRYAGASPRMSKGVAVLTNGEEWRLYDMSRTGLRFTSKLICEVDITNDSRGRAARKLNHWLARSQW